MRLLALTFGNSDAASTKYRILQYEELFRAADISVTCMIAREFRDFSVLGNFDAVLLQKTLLPANMVKKIRQGAKRFLYDADDLTWLCPQKQYSWLTRLRIAHRLRIIAGQADLCMAANRTIAGDLKRAGGRTAILPMALDGRVWQDAPERGEGELSIGWSGAPKNLVFLRQILPQLQEVQRRFPHVSWLVHSGEDPRFSGFRYTHIPFELGAEHLTVRRFHIGLLPLPDEPFVRGKSPIKALQYFASRVAVAGSPVGATIEILEDGKNAVLVRDNRGWVDALSLLITDAELRRSLAEAGRRSFEERYEIHVVFEHLRKLVTGAK